MAPKALALFAFVFVCAAPGFARAEEPSGAPAEASAEHARGEHEEGESAFNWAYGFLGEKEGVEPSLAYRPKGMAPPFVANIVNFLVLVTIIVAVGKKPIALGLQQRKERIVQGMEEAGRMKAEAAERLAGYEEKLKHLDREVARIRGEMREAAEGEQRRVLQEAKERRERMERDARLLVEQETKAAREALSRETVVAAMRSAEALIEKSLAAADHERMTVEYFETLRRAPLSASGARS